MKTKQMIKPIVSKTDKMPKPQASKVGQRNLRVGFLFSSSFGSSIVILVGSSVGLSVGIC